METQRVEKMHHQNYRNNTVTKSELTETFQPKTGGKKSGHAAGTGDHSTVTKSGHKAVVAPTAGQEEGDYNTITHHRQKCPPAGEARDATGNIYSLPESCSVRAKVSHQRHIV